MYTPSFEYLAPESLEEALDRLAGDPEARPLAGGQSLVPILRLRLASPSALVDLRRLDVLRRIGALEGEGPAERPGEGPGGGGASGSGGGPIAVGAMVTHARVASAPELAGGGLRALSRAALAIGDAQVRNTGTLGGSLAHADPAADLPAAVVALGATLVVVGPDGEREIPAEDFFTGFWTTALGPGEILREVRLPRRTSAGGAYRKLAQPASGFALVGAAAVVERDGERCASARVAVTGVGMRPRRLPAIEEALPGTPLEEPALREVCAGAGEAIEAPQDDLHASAEYRRAMVEVVARRALLEAAAKAPDGEAAGS